MISLTAFDQVNLSEDKLTADIGVGLRWLSVYKALDQYDLAVSNYEVWAPSLTCSPVSDLR